MAHIGRKSAMTVEYIDRRLERGEQMGFTIPTQSDDYLGWILVSKRKPNERFLEIAVRGEDESTDLIIQQEELLRQRPYQLLVLEIKREVHGSGRYPAGDDQRLKESYQFVTLEEVGAFVAQYGLKLEEIQPLFRIHPLSSDGPPS
jgi:hypothetical protein